MRVCDWAALELAELKGLEVELPAFEGERVKMVRLTNSWRSIFTSASLGAPLRQAWDAYRNQIRVLCVNEAGPLEPEGWLSLTCEGTFADRYARLLPVEAQLQAVGAGEARSKLTEVHDYVLSARGVSQPLVLGPLRPGRYVLELKVRGGFAGISMRKHSCEVEVEAAQRVDLRLDLRAGSFKEERRASRVKERE